MRQQLDRATAALPVELKPQDSGFRDLLAVLIRRRWVFCAVAVPIVVASAIGTLRSSDTVTAGSRVMIEAQQPENPTLGGPRIVDYTMLMSSAAQVAMSIPVATKAAAALKDSLPALAQEAPALAAIKRPERLRDILLRHVEASQIGESNILSIVFRHPSPRFALMAVGALTDAYIDYSVVSQRNMPAIDYFTEQIKGVQAGVDSLMSLRAELRNTAGVSALQTNAAAGISQLMEMERDLIKNRSLREGLEAKLAAVIAARAGDPDFVPTSNSVENPNLVGLKSRVEELTAKLSALRVEFQEDSQWVARQKELLVAAREELRLELDRYVINLRVSLEEVRKTEQAYVQAVNERRAALASYPDVERRIDSLDMQIDAQRSLLRELQLKRGEVGLKARTDMRVSNIIPLDTPTIAERVGGSKKLLYLGLATILAIALGFIATRFVENMDHRLYERRRAEKFLEVPVLGAVSDIRNRLS